MKETIALNALIKAEGDVSKAKASVSIRISARTWAKARDKYFAQAADTARDRAEFMLRVQKASR